MPDMNENRESQQEYFGRANVGRMNIEEREKTILLQKLSDREKRIEELEAQIEKMKCCGNCKGVCDSDDVAHFCKNNDYKLWEIKND